MTIIPTTMVTDSPKKPVKVAFSSHSQYAQLFSRVMALLLVGGMLLPAVTFAKTLPPTTKPGYDIIIVAGQSNAVGKGIGPQTYPGPTQEDGKIFQIGRYGVKAMQLIPAVEPLEFWANQKNDGKGFAMPFARYYASSTLAANRQVIIIPAAHGETSILQWLGVLPTDGLPDKNILWDDMNARVNYALSLPGDNKVVAILWQQGEQDVIYATTPTDPNNILMPDARVYHKELTVLVARFRKFYGPNVPLLMGEMSGEWLTGTHQKAVKNSFTDVIQEVTTEGAHLAFVSSNGLTSDADINPAMGNIHFSAEAQSILGARYYKTFTH